MNQSRIRVKGRSPMFTTSLKTTRSNRITVYLRPGEANASVNFYYVEKGCKEDDVGEDLGPYDSSSSQDALPILSLEN